MGKTLAKELVVIAADHNGVALKSKVRTLLGQLGYRCIDIGPYDAMVAVDYVDFARQLGMIVRNKDCDKGILICGTGVGMSIAVNKVDGIRASLCHNLETARKSREHNDSNVLCLGAWIDEDVLNLEIVSTWLNEKFGEHRHVRRIEKMASHSENIVFTNGIFDILHTGHIELLKFSKSLGNRLIVGINTDASTRKLKGPERPINKEIDRKAVLQCIKYVDEVVVFDEAAPTALIRSLMPDIVVKGGEWTSDEVRKRDHIPDGVQVKIFPLVTGYSSSNIISHIKKGAA